MFRCVDNGVAACTWFYVAHLWLCPSCSACCTLCSSTTLPHGNEDNRELHFPELKFSTAFFLCCRRDNACCRCFLFSFYICVFSSASPRFCFSYFGINGSMTKFGMPPGSNLHSPLDVLLETLLTMKSYCRSHLLLVETQLARFIASVFQPKNWTWVENIKRQNHLMRSVIRWCPWHPVRQGLPQPISSFLMVELSLKRAGRKIMLSYVDENTLIVFKEPGINSVPGTDI